MIVEVGNSLLDMNKVLKKENEYLTEKVEALRIKGENDYAKNQALLEEKKTFEMQVAYLKALNEELQRDLASIMQTEKANVPMMPVSGDSEAPAHKPSKSPLLANMLPPLKSASDEKKSAIGSARSGTLSRLVLFSVDGCSSPMGKTPVGKAFREKESPFISNRPVKTPKSVVIPHEIGEKDKLHAESMSISSAEIENFNQSDPAVSEMVVSEFLKLELGDLYQPDKLFANLNLFQLRYGRRVRERESLLLLLLFSYSVSMRLMQESLEAAKHNFEVSEIKFSLFQKKVAEELDQYRAQLDNLTGQLLVYQKEAAEKELALNLDAQNLINMQNF